MKRTYCILTVLILAVVIGFSLGAKTTAADASSFTPPVLQREETVMLEGMPEALTITLFRWEGILSLWYDAQSFVPAITSCGVRFDLIVNKLSEPVSLSIDDIWDPDGSDESALSNAQDEYEREGWVCKELDTDGIMPSFHFADEPVLGFIAQKDGQIVQVYITSVASGSYLCTMRFPQEAAEGWGTRMTHMLNTLEPMPGE